MFRGQGQFLGKNQKLTSLNGCFTAIMKDNGNFVVHNSKGLHLWESNTENKGDFIILQTDGNIVIYKINGHRINATWSSKTWHKFSDYDTWVPNPNHQLIM